MRRIWGVLGGKDDLLQLDPTLLAGTGGTGLKTVVRVIELFLVASQASTGLDVVLSLSKLVSCR